ncbi:tRNA1(Val) (adenine(37)-N6)-methyltransferase [Hydrogenimonas urashimensis]|uniref:tRNA1(Val) (adenine(37)-N6)-methyltransferase n=1 Tax=Hydrogenimonas urashimensis TaxID=2740515 RepID=UPI0019163768|nr:methyltransferase [Hydrogenimonas urashimensis]
MLFYQPEEGYRFNSDSMFLYDFISSFAPRGKVLDVGCGVGVIGLLLARDFPIELTMVEKQEMMAKLAEKNINANRVEAELVRSDFLDFDSKKRFDLIVSNPPFYHPKVIRSDDEHMQICRYNDHLPIEPFFGKVKSLLAPRGRFIFCYDARQVGALFARLADVGLRVEDVRFVHPKKERPAKLVLIHARNNSKGLCRVWPPFIVFEGDAYGEEAEKIFKKARTHTLKCLI